MDLASPWVWSGLTVAAGACPIFLGVLSGRLPWVAPLFRDGDRASWFPFFGTTAAWLWLALAAVVVLMAPGGVSLSSVGARLPSALEAGVGAAAVVLLALGALAIGARSTGPGPTAPGLVIFPHTTAERLAMVLVFAPTAAICEETIYRGFLLVPLTALVGFWPANMLQSLLFAFHHGGLRQPLGAFLGRAVFGLALGFVAARTGTLLAVIAIHLLWDALLALKPSSVPRTAPA